MTTTKLPQPTVARCPNCPLFVSRQAIEIRWELDYDYDHYERTATPVQAIIGLYGCKGCGYEWEQSCGEDGLMWYEPVMPRFHPRLGFS